MSEYIHALLMLLPIVNTLQALKKARPIDVVNAHWLYPDGVAAVWACRLLGLPVVITALGCDVNFYAAKPIIGRQIAGAVRDSDLATAVSRELAHKMADWRVNGEPVQVIPNGVDLSLFQAYEKGECRTRLSIPPGDKIVLFIGRLSDEKGFDILIKGIELMENRQALDYVVIVIGDGPERQRYESDVKQRGLSHRFSFKGALEHSLIPIWLGAADVLCLPSVREGCPNVIMESLAAGRPVVASRIGGIPDMVQDGINGYLFDPGKAVELASCLEKALNAGWDQKKIRRLVEGKSWLEVAKSYDDIYAHVLNKSTS